MKVYDDYCQEAVCSLKKVLLVYTNGAGRAFCTINAVKKGEDGPIVEEGVPVNAQNLSELFDLIGRKPKDKLHALQWCNDRILAEGPGSVLWYAPAQRREIFFSCKNQKLMKISGKEFPFPALLFHARKNHLCVYVLGSSRRPTVETVLYQAPFWNVSANGTVCLPTLARDKSHTPEEWEEIFFRSAFSHAGGAAFKDGTVETIFPHLVKEKYAKFPVKNCFRHKFKVGDLLERKKQQ
jgi:PRTRC genetic system protein B